MADAIANITKKIKEVEAALQAVRAEIDSINGRVSALSNTERQLRKELQEEVLFLEGAREALTRAAGDPNVARAAIQRHSDRIQEINQQLRELPTQLADEKKTLSDKKKEKETITARLKKLKEQLKTKKASTPKATAKSAATKSSIPKSKVAAATAPSAPKAKKPTKAMSKKYAAYSAAATLAAATLAAATPAGAQSPPNVAPGSVVGGVMNKVSSVAKKGYGWLRGGGPAAAAGSGAALAGGAFNMFSAGLKKITSLFGISSKAMLFFVQALGRAVLQLAKLTQVIENTSQTLSVNFEQASKILFNRYLLSINSLVSVLPSDIASAVASGIGNLPAGAGGLVENIKSALPNTIKDAVAEGVSFLPKSIQDIFPKNLSKSIEGLLDKILPDTLFQEEFSRYLTVKDISELQENFSKAFGGVLTDAGVKLLGEESVKLNIPRAQYIQAVRAQARIAGSIEKAQQTIRTTTSAFKEASLTGKDAAEFIAQNSNILARNGDRFAAGLTRAAIEAKKAGYSLQSIEGFGDKIVTDFEGFLEEATAGAAMGMQFDIPRLIQASISGDTEALKNELQSQLVGMGGTLDNLSRPMRVQLERMLGMPLEEILGIRSAKETAESATSLMNKQAAEDQTAAANKMRAAADVMATAANVMLSVATILGGSKLFKYLLRSGGGSAASTAAGTAAGTAATAAAGAAAGAAAQKRKLITPGTLAKGAVIVGGGVAAEVAADKLEENKKEKAAAGLRIGAQTAANAALGYQIGKYAGPVIGGILGIPGGPAGIAGGASMGSRVGPAGGALLFGSYGLVTESLLQYKKAQETTSTEVKKLTTETTDAVTDLVADSSATIQQIQRDAQPRLRSERRPLLGGDGRPEGAPATGTRLGVGRYVQPSATYGAGYQSFLDQWRGIPAAKTDPLALAKTKTTLLPDAINFGTNKPPKPAFIPPEIKDPFFGIPSNSQSLNFQGFLDKFKQPEKIEQNRLGQLTLTPSDIVKLQASAIERRANEKLPPPMEVLRGVGLNKFLQGMPNWARQLMPAATQLAPEQYPVKDSIKVEVDTAKTEENLRELIALTRKTNEKLDMLARQDITINMDGQKVGNAIKRNERVATTASSTSRLNG